MARDICFALLPEFPLYALVPAIEALRLANQNAGETLYDWAFASGEGGPVRAGNGMVIEATRAVSPGFSPGFVVVCAGNDPTRTLRRDLLDWLHRRAVFGARLGALDTGAFALAAAGVLSGYRLTLHWEAIPAFLDIYPDADVVEELFVVDRGRWTCAGGTAALDMMLTLIEEDHGSGLAQIVANGFVHGRPRRGQTPQRPARETIASPTWQRVSRRTVERLSREVSGASPASHYLGLRLERARDQLFYTEDPIRHVAEVTGFQSSAHFCRAFKERFGATPSAFRRRSSAEKRHSLHPTGLRISKPSEA